MKSKSGVPLISIICIVMVFVISACGSTKLLDIDKTSKTLKLSEIQRNVVQSKVEQIARIVEDYELEKETLESEIKKMRDRMRAGGGGGFGGAGRRGGGGRGGGMQGDFQRKMQVFNQQRTESQNQIDALVAEIQEILEEEQQEKFAEIKLPELETPDLPRGGGRGGGFGGRRRGGGGGGRGGGGGGGFDSQIRP
ncbi:MAG: hypothetical protein O7E52_05690 [Candidatus Poribacteria bacterium]|nr:hypothetical protein [Candidatus Poribacteria bacterium]